MSAQASDHECEVIVVDDASTDSSCVMVERDFNAVRLLKSTMNRGFGETANLGAREARGEVLIFLNNDLVAKEAMIRELVAPLLEDAGLFGVSGKTVAWGTGEPNHVNMAAAWRKGGFELRYEDSHEPAATMFVQGGACALRRDTFLSLGAFCPLFSPGYWEDYDISYLALKAGWRNLYNPRAVGYHIGQGSFVRRHGAREVGFLKHRNAFLFSWLNLTDVRLLRQHCGSLPPVAAGGCLREGYPRMRLRGMMRAFGLLGPIGQERERRRPLLRRSDSDILAEFQNHGGTARTP
jgi:GT2 family glycosyltransferase